MNVSLYDLIACKNWYHGGDKHIKLGYLIKTLKLPKTETSWQHRARLYIVWDACRDFGFGYIAVMKIKKNAVMRVQRCVCA